ncbi:DNA polymerase III subunit delta [Nitrosococcus watsonii]|uniref:DNA polymerase III subunit delta n=1 Tax=Nitrosococcus watsoni (strain C-113) TaxID=105559 RepID=D8KAA3_NITWC|nr:DNA polymerase III subunit delta [Nitrosococcus watsonii]ADJ27418.1 DNA polymerase III, delta subunit [Nitrosococcus watsonii C-113]
MRVKLEQLAAHLERGTLAPVYLLFGDEPLLIEEGADLIRSRAQSQGFYEREVMHIERGFDWAQLQWATKGLSLFAARRLIELRLPKNAVSEAGTKVLRTYGENPSPDTLLLIISDKLERRHQVSRWFSALEQTGVVVQIFKVDISSLSRWIEHRLRSRSLSLTQEAVAVLVERLEGNLLACAQEIDRLALLFPKETIDASRVEEIVADNARYDVFRLMESALAGDVVQIARIWRGLQAEGVEPVIVVGALAWELRRLARMARACAQGKPVDQTLREQRVWERRKIMTKKALSRHSVHRWLLFLQQLGKIDCMVKGAVRGRPWEAILQLCLAIAGAELFPPSLEN